jgi:type IV secretory pathway TraG/TraD family ATPase VirD4
VAALDETKHFKLIGTTGTGKSTAIRELLAGALGRGDRAIIADPDGGYLARFKDTSRGDVVLNPFDSESLRWDLFGEINNAYDIDQLARSLLPDQGGPDRSWISYARTFFGSVTRQAHEAGVTDLRELYRLLVVADAKELRGLLAGTPAQPFLEEHNGRMFDSIRSVTSSAVGSLDYIAQQTTGPLSIRRWVREGEGGVLFIPYQAGQIAALRSTISAWMRLAIFEAMSQPEGDQRLWFVVDELDALGQIDGLKDALARLRKFGGRCVLGFQSIAQVSSTYGTGDAQTIVENCGNTLILRCSGSDHGGTANFASRLIGQREVLRTNRSRSRRPGDFLSSTTLSEHIGIEPAVMDSQIEQLPDLSGYLKFASVPDWQRVTLAAPNSSDDAHTRSEARTFWQQWRATHEPHAPHDADASHAADARQTAAATYARNAATRTPTSRAAAPNPSFARDGVDHE